MNPIDRENLEIGKIYYIECITYDDHNNVVPNNIAVKMAGIFKGFNLIDVWYTPPWKEAIFDWFNVAKLKYIKNINDVYNIKTFTVNLNYRWRFFEVKKYKMQSDMESRAVNLYLQSIINDKWFHYYNVQKE
jgi:hypothetical protein